MYIKIAISILEKMSEIEPKQLRNRKLKIIAFLTFILVALTTVITLITVSSLNTGGDTGGGG